MYLNQKIQNQLPSWKAIYGAIFLQQVGGQDYVFRTCSKREAEYLISGVDTLEEEALRAVLLYPIDKELPDHFGQYQRIIKAVLTASGYADANFFRDRLFKSREKYFSNELEQTVIVSMICTAFPGITVDNVEEWPASKVLKYLSHSEIMLGTQLEQMLATFKKNPQQQSAPESGKINKPVKKKKQAPKKNKDVNFETENELLRQFLGNPNEDGQYTFHGPAR
jgi:hypothetical protein